MAIDENKPIKVDNGWKLLEEMVIEGRAIVVWQNPEDNIISLIITHLTKQPNEISKKSGYTQWGYVTKMISNISTCKEAAEVVGLYQKDLEIKNFWWEK